MGGRWIGTVVGLALGGVAGWLFGRSIAQSIQGSGGPIGPDFPATIGLVGLAVGVITLVVIAALLARSRRRRGLAVALISAAVGLVGGYFVGLTLD